MFAIVFNVISLNSGTRRHHHRASSLVNKKVEEILESFLYQNVIRSLIIQWANWIFMLQYPETVQQTTFQERLGNYLYFLSALWQDLRMGNDNMVTKIAGNNCFCEIASSWQYWQCFFLHYDWAACRIFIRRKSLVGRKFSKVLCFTFCSSSSRSFTKWMPKSENV